MNKDIEIIKASIVEVLKKFGVKKAALFGSIVKEGLREDSDIDIIVEFSGDDKSLLDLVRLKYALEDRLGRNVDLITYRSLHPLLKERVLNEQKVII